MRYYAGRLLIAAALCAGGVTLIPLPAAAQQVPATRTATRPAEEVLAQLGANAGVVVLADATIFARLPVTRGAATVEGVEQQLAELVQVLPPGTTWVKLYMPAPASGRWNAEIVADYARAQARLLGPATRAGSRPAPPGTVEIFGRTLPADKASEYTTALNLKLVYLVTNPRPASAALAVPGTLAAAEWSRLSPEQRDQYVQQQTQQLMRLDPATRLQALRQLMRREPMPQDMVVKSVVSQMSPEERIQFRQSLSVDRAPAGK
jgi:hypothetical protein